MGSLFIVHAPYYTRTWMNVDYWWKHNCMENTEVPGQKPVPVRHPLQFPRRILWTQPCGSLLICCQLAPPVVSKRWTSSKFSHPWSWRGWLHLWPVTGWSRRKLGWVISVVYSKGSTENWDVHGTGENEIVTKLLSGNLLDNILWATWRYVCTTYERPVYRPSRYEAGQSCSRYDWIASVSYYRCTS
jgi:hypothetical protein